MRYYYEDAWQIEDNIVVCAPCSKIVLKLFPRKQQYYKTNEVDGVKFYVLIAII